MSAIINLSRRAAGRALPCCAVLWLVVVAQAGCDHDEASEGRLAEVEPRPVDLGAQAFREPPREFRHLWPSPDPEASELLDRLAASPGDPELRQRLAEHYRLEGYLAAASFVEATAGPLRGEIVRFGAPAGPVAWGLGGEGALDRLEEERSRARRVCDLTLEGRYQEAVDVADALLRQGPYSAIEVGVWAHAALWYIVADAGPVEPGVAEMAFRVYLTGLEEGLEPECAADRASGHWLLSQLFQQMGDPVSAYAAAAIEHELTRKTLLARPAADPLAEARRERLESLRAAVERLSVMGRRR